VYRFLYRFSLLPELRAALEQLYARAVGDVALAVAAGEIVTLPFDAGSLALRPTSY